MVELPEDDDRCLGRDQFMQGQTALQHVGAGVVLGQQPKSAAVGVSKRRSASGPALGSASVGTMAEDIAGRGAGRSRLWPQPGASWSTPFLVSARNSRVGVPGHAARMRTSSATLASSSPRERRVVR